MPKPSGWRCNDNEKCAKMVLHLCSVIFSRTPHLSKDSFLPECHEGVLCMYVGEYSPSATSDQSLYFFVETVFIHQLLNGQVHAVMPVVVGI